MSVEQLKQRKMNAFDPILAGIIAERVIYYYGLRTKEKYKPVIKELTPIVINFVNPEIISTIVTGQNDLSMNKWIARTGALYLPEDRVRSELRSLIAFFHPASDRRFTRSLTETCLNVVANILNSDTVGDQLHAATRKALAA